MAEKVVIGKNKTNGVTKTGVGTYFFSYKTKKDNKEFKRTKTFNCTKGISVVRTEYNRWLKEVQDEYENNKDKSNIRKSIENYRFIELTDDPNGHWQEWVVNEKYAKGSQKNMLDNMRVINSYTEFSELKFKDIAKEQCLHIINTIQRKNNAEPDTMRKYRQALSSVFEYIADKISPDYPNYAKSIKIVDKKDKSVTESEEASENIITGDEIKVVIDRIERDKDFQFQVFIKTILSTGLRRGEMYALKWEDIKFDQNYIEVNHTLIEYKGAWVLELPKNGKKRVAPLLPSLKKLLLEYKEYYVTEGFQTCDENGKDRDFVFSKKSGEPFGLRRYGKNFKQIIDKLNEEKLLKPSPTIHSLRGTAITRFLNDKSLRLPPSIVTEIVGHKDPSVTFKYYVKTTKQDIIDLADEFDIKD